MLSIRNLSISIHDQPIINNVCLDIPTGSLTALVGPNGSGKSTLAYALAGHPLYHITNGTITFNDQDITNSPSDARARAGLFLIMQNPPEIPGVNVLTFLYESYRALHPAPKFDALSQANPHRAHSESSSGSDLKAFDGSRNEGFTPEAPRRIEESERESDNVISPVDFKTQATQALQAVGLPDTFLSRSLHEGFSGGEKKRFEAAQLLLFKPTFAILDELDAGLDATAFEAVIHVIKNLKAENPAFTCLLITHNPRMLEIMQPDQILTMAHGKLSAISLIS